MGKESTYQELQKRVEELEGQNADRFQACAMQEKILENILPVCVTGRNYEILFTNSAYNSIFGKPHDGMKCFESRKGSACHTENCPLARVLRGTGEYACESLKVGNAGEEDRSFIVIAKPLLDAEGKPVGVIESFQDITDRKRVERERELLIEELRKSMEKVKLLSGYLPICASCKKIRDDKGYWTQVEAYIRSHSEVEFSHGICPECMHKLYPELVDKE